MWTRQSIHWRLSSWLIGGISVLLVVAGLVLDAIASHQFRQSFDDALLAKARALVTLTEQYREGVELEFADEFMPEFEDPKAPSYFQMWLGDGSVLERSRSLDDQDFVSFGELSNELRFVDAVLPDGRDGRWVGFIFPVQVDEKVRDIVEQQSAGIMVAEERERLDRVIASIHAALVLTGIVIIISIMLLIRFTVGAGLSPLTKLRQQVAVLDDRSLASRLALERPTEELEGLVDQFNGLLSRLQAAFSREKQFSSDVAHELRTPLAELRNLAEVGSRWPDDHTMVKKFFGDVIDATAQMERIVVTLLALARKESSKVSVNSAEFDLADLVKQVWLSVRVEAEAKGLIFEYSGPERFVIYSAWDQWFLILTNLFNNAVSYSRMGGKISCSLKWDSLDLTLKLVNPTQDLVQQDLDHIFDQFWRKDQARSGGQHAGLGLTLVTAYAEQLSLSAEARLIKPDLFEISLSGAMQLPPPEGNKTKKDVHQ